MSDYFEHLYDAESFRRQAHELVDQLADYLGAATKGKDMPVLPWKDPQKEYEFWKNYLAAEGAKDNPAEYYNKVLENSIHLHHPNYIGHQVVPPLPQTALTGLLEDLINNSMAVYEVGPASTAIERVVIEWLLSFIGWRDNANGLITSGGSLGNLTAMLAARQRMSENDSWKNGIDNNMAVMISSESHYSIERSVRMMGLGDDSIIKLPVDEQYRIKADNLEELLSKARSNGKKVIALAANACSTATGKYDPLNELGDFCKKNDIWFHVDAAHGGPAIFSDKYKHLLGGIELADSVVIDFHKMMLTPALTTAVLFKKGEDSYRSFAQKADYLLSSEQGWYDIAKRSIECTKKPMSLKVFLMIKLHGSKLFRRYVEQTYDLGKQFAAMIRESKDFELAVEPDSNIVCFRFNDGNSSDEQLNQINAALRDKLIKDGTFYIVQTMLRGKLYLRITIMNPLTKKENLKNLLAELMHLKSHLHE